MDINILGPLNIDVGGVSTAPSAPKLRSVFATLVLHAGQVVPTSSLIGELWDDCPPNSGLTTLQTYILNLRKMLAAITSRPLAEIAGEMLVTRVGGYLFNVGSGVLDFQLYNSVVVAARELIASGDDRRGVLMLNDALRLWRGPALVDVSVGRVLESKRRQFEESRLMVLEYLIDTQLRLGMHREVLPELVALTGDNPLHEGLHAQYMRALHTSGRRAQALMVFRELRDNLVRELGLEPCLPVRRLHQAILRSEGSLADARIEILHSDVDTRFRTAQLC
jgi:DNA-binding SARP family transcriptional activator